VYIATFPESIQPMLKKLRTVIKEAAPEAEEKISYQMPAYMLRGPLVYFAAYKTHIGFYPTSSGIRNFQDELTDYKTSKGAVQFPINESLPYDLIRRIVKFRVEENSQK
jgi:Uncharacterized conserved protein